MCYQCPDGHLHRWLASIANRSRGSGCPQCRGARVCKHNSLATKAPQIAAQWHFSKNICTPDDITYRSNGKRHWLCQTCGHEWMVAVADRVRYGSGCPKCHQGRKRNSSSSSHPTFHEDQHPLLKQWDHKRNAAIGLFPDAITLGSKKSVWWLCNSCPAGQEHSWPARPCDRTRAGIMATGCPVCHGKVVCRCNSLQSHYPAIAAEWDSERNKGTPNDYVSSSSHVAWWLSAKRGSWQQSIMSRASGQVSKVTGSLKTRK